MEAEAGHEQSNMTRAKRLSVTPSLTAGYAPEIEHQLRTSYVGMAHFANSGPFGRVCGECIHYGCWIQHRSASGDIIKTTHVRGACAKFRELTGKLGPAVPASASACRYFEAKQGS
jgi:hypothetical protein